MLILPSVTDSITAVLNAAKTANDMQFYTGYRDVTTSTFVPGRNVGVTSGTTPVSLSLPPLSDTQRIIDDISVYNADTAAKILTITYSADGTTRILWKGSIGVNERVQYQDGSGWKLFDQAGQEKVSQALNSAPLASSGWTSVVLSGDVINNNAVANTLQDVTGLLFPVVAGSTYYFECMIPYTSAATGTGSRWTINGPAFTMLSYTSEYTLAATTKTVNSATAYQIPAASSATSLTTGNVATLWGFVKPSANGNIQVQFASEVLSSAITAKAGGFIRWMTVL